jgi:hypothetical protein
MAEIPNSESERYVVRADAAMYHDGVRVVEMNCCGFSFAAAHEDWTRPSSEWVEQYTCPICAPPEITDEMVERTARALWEYDERQFSKDSPPFYVTPWDDTTDTNRDDECKRARRALAAAFSTSRKDQP